MGEAKRRNKGGKDARYADVVRESLSTHPQADLSPLDKFDSGQEDYFKAILIMAEADPSNAKLMELH
jgi:hypothetical protein